MYGCGSLSGAVRPDRNGGDNEDFQREVAALKVLVPRYNSVRNEIDAHYALGYYSMIQQLPSSSLAVSADESKVCEVLKIEGISLTESDQVKRSDRVTEHTEDNENENKSVTDHGAGVHAN